jgi:hypothetical protein
MKFASKFQFLCFASSESMKVFLLAALLCVVPLISGKAVDETTSKCLVNYLRNKGFLGAKDETPKEELSEDCFNIVKKARDERIDFHSLFLTMSKATSNYSECLVEFLNKTALFDRELIGLLDLSKAKADPTTITETWNLVGMKRNLEIMKGLQSCEVAANV